MPKLFFIAAFGVLALMPFGVFAKTQAEIDASIRDGGSYKKAIVPCGFTTIEGTGENTVRKLYNECGFTDALAITRNIIMGLIFVGATIATLGFAYAGYLYITAAGSQEKISHAHSIFIKTGFGFLFMLSAWLIAKVFEDQFLKEEFRNRSFLERGP